jgi:hypothetical protein
MQQLGPAFMADLAATFGDPSAFSELVFGTPLHAGQRAYSERATADLNFLLPGNSWGKTEFIVRHSLYTAWFKDGPLRPTEFTEWATSMYNILLASFEYDTIGEAFDRYETYYNNNPCVKALIRSIISSPRGEVILNNGAKIDFGTLKDNGKHVEATRYSAIYVDEVGHIPDISYTWDSVLYPRTMGVSGRTHFIGTPKPHSDPYLLEIFEKGKDGKDPFYYSYSGSVLENEFWTEDERQRVMRNPRYVRGWEPVEAGEDLGIMQKMVRDVDGVPCVPVLTQMGKQVILGHFILAGGYFFNRFHVQRMFQWDEEWGTVEWHGEDQFAVLQGGKVAPAGRLYMGAFDIAGNKAKKGLKKGKGSDPTVGIVLDITERPWKVVYFNYIRGGDADWEEKYQVMKDVFLTYRLPYLLIDATGNVSSVQEALQDRGVEVEGVQFGGSSNKKFEMVRNLQLCTEMEWSGHRGVLRSPLIPQLKYELDHYILPDDEIVQDCVMTLAMVAFETAQYETPVPAGGEVY